MHAVGAVRFPEILGQLWQVSFLWCLDCAVAFRAQVFSVARLAHPNKSWVPLLLLCAKQDALQALFRRCL